jgi:hypothetical protein
MVKVFDFGLYGSRIRADLKNKTDPSRAQGPADLRGRNGYVYLTSGTHLLLIRVVC